MPIVWTEKARAELEPRRPEDVKPFSPGKPQTAWDGLRKSLAPRGNFNPIASAFVTGRGKTTPELAKLMEKAEALVRTETTPSLDDVEAVAAMYTLLCKVAQDKAQTWLLAAGPLPKAFEIHMRSLEFTVEPKWQSYNNPFHLMGASATDVAAPEIKLWRWRLLSQPAEVRDACKAVAKRVVSRGPNLGQQTTIAFTFFDDPDVIDGNEVCRAWLAKGLDRYTPLYAIVGDFDLACELVKHKEGSWAYFDLIEKFGERMLPVLVELAKTPFDRWHCKEVAESLALFDDPAAAEGMLKLLEQASSRPLALAYFGRFPQHAAAALTSIENMKGRAAKIAREVLAGAQRALSSAVDTADEASADEMPRVLAQPPWLDEKKPKRPATKLELLRIDVPERVDWHEGEKERALGYFPKPDKPASEETLADYAKMRAEGKWVDVVKHKNEALPDALVLEAWNAGQKTYTYGSALPHRVQYMLAKFGDAAMPGLEHIVDQLTHGYGDSTFMLRIASHRLALPFARQVTHARIGKLAWPWLQKHAELAVVTLVPVAFGDDATARGHAERALFRLKAVGVDIVSIGERYGKEAKAALDKLMAWDPVYDLPKTIPKLGPSWNASILTRPKLLSNGKPIPLSAVDTLATMLAFSPLTPPYAGIVQVKEACNPRALAELSWEAARAWEHAGHKKKDKWMLMSLVHFADDEVVRRLTPGVRPDFAVEALEIIATDAALMEMATIAERSETSSTSMYTLAGRIEQILERAAEARGVTKDELEEDLAPTTMLEEDGTLILDYGSRKLQVGFDERLEPFVRNESGGRSRAVPPARKEDDPAKVEHAKTIWRDLKEDVTVIGARRIKALERAMTSGRMWTIERFRRVWLDHRLMKHVARGVVWTDGTTAFRVGEDGSLSNVDDDPYELSPTAKIGVAHPLRLTPDDRRKWCTLFEDYKIMQSFPQVGREYLAMDLVASRTPWPFPALKWSDLTRRLLERGFHQGPTKGSIYSYLRYLPAGGAMRIELTWDKGAAKDVTVVFLRGEEEVPAKELDRIAVADTLYELQS